MKTSLKFTLASAIFLTLSSTMALGSHFRYGHYVWSQVSGNTVRVTLQNAFRRDGYGCVDPATLAFVACSPGDGFPQVGDVIRESIGGTRFNWGDGTEVGSPLGPLLYKVTSIDLVNNWWFGLAIDPGALPLVSTTLSHTYASSGNYTAFTSSCCRISSVDGINAHINNPDDGYRVETLINVGGNNNSPVSALPPIVLCPINSLCQFAVPAVDPDNNPLHFRLSTSAEASDSGFLHPGPPFAPNTATIDPTTGVFSWNTTGATLASPGLNTLYSTQVTIQDGTSKVAIDFLIQLVNADPSPPIIVPPVGSPPVCNTTQVATVGSLKTFDAVASDPDAGDLVTLNVVGLPLGATMNPQLPRTGNPISSRFSWTPTANQIGQHVVLFNATSSAGGFALCPVTINVQTQPACDAPSSIFANNVEASGLVEAVVSNSRTENGKRVADVTIDNFLRGLWLEVTDIRLSDASNDLVPNTGAGTAGLFAQFGLIPPCETGLNGLLRCKNPGRAAWVAKFCDKGTMTIEMQQTPRAAAFTLLDALLGQTRLLNINSTISLIRDLENEVPLFAQATHCFSPLTKSSYGCAGKSLFQLAANRDQRHRMSDVLFRFGIALGADELIKLLTGAGIHLVQTAADGIVFIIQTTNAGTYPSVRVVLDGDSFAIAKSSEHHWRTSKRRDRANHRTQSNRLAVRVPNSSSRFRKNTRPSIRKNKRLTSAL